MVFPKLAFYSFRVFTLSNILLFVQSTKVQDSDLCQQSESILEAALLQRGTGSTKIRFQSEAEVDAESVAETLPFCNYCGKPIEDGGMTIPRIIHQSWKDAAVPTELQEWHKSWSENGLSDWKHFFWTDAKIEELLLSYPWFKETYFSLPEKIMRIDVARAMMLHMYGGVYADMDVGVLKDPSALFKGTGLTFFLAPDAVYEATSTVEMALMGSPRGHPFWISYMKYVQGQQRSMVKTRNLYDVFDVTGPRALSHVLAQYMQPGSASDIKIFPSRYWYPFWLRGNSTQAEIDALSCWTTDICRKKYPEAYMVHHFAHSWGTQQKADIRNFAKKHPVAASMLQIPCSCP
eukprot:TRINITY_DN17504_c0_g1_i1.p1 TRINITY_DN17504_c0_g1~~TRINITY_DN17504_c0_g1_i1.p1  ORF type:complete len:348 (+),score=54.39 TRINITY_DN17504_c0_g1_i1:137-1180(+)